MPGCGVALTFSGVINVPTDVSAHARQMLLKIFKIINVQRNDKAFTVYLLRAARYDVYSLSAKIFIAN